MAKVFQYFFGTGRSALKAGLLHLGFKAGSRVLVPDFICDVLLHPILDSDLIPVFYPLIDSLNPEWTSLDVLAREYDCVALFMVHYFGQPQDFDVFRLFCSRHNLLLIEDNAHGFGGFLNGQPLGSLGDIGISSPRKLLGTPSGGVLYTHNDLQNSFITNLAAYPLFRPKSILKMLFSGNKSLSLFSNFFSLRDKDLGDPLAYSSSVEPYYRIDIFSHWRIVSTDWNNVSASRRKNWYAWSTFAINHGLKLVFPLVHPHSCPWAIPVYARDLSERNNWLSWANTRRVALFPWPSLCKQVVLSNSKALVRWNRMFCILLDSTPPKI